MLAVQLDSCRRSARRRSARYSAKCRCATGRPSCRGCCRRTIARLRCKSDSSCRSAPYRARRTKRRQRQAAGSGACLRHRPQSPGRRCRSWRARVVEPISAASIGRKRSVDAPQDGQESGGATPSWIQPQTLHRNMGELNVLPAEAESSWQLFTRDDCRWLITNYRRDTGAAIVWPAVHARTSELLPIRLTAAAIHGQFDKNLFKSRYSCHRCADRRTF